MNGEESRPLACSSLSYMVTPPNLPELEFDLCILISVIDTMDVSEYKYNGIIIMRSPLPLFVHDSS